MQGGEEFTWRGEGGALLVGLLRWRCCGGDRWLCRGSRTATPSSGATVPSGGERGYCSSLFLCFLSSSFVFQWFPFTLSVCFLNFLPRFKLFLPLPMFWFHSFYSLYPLPFGSFFFLFGSFSFLSFRFFSLPRAGVQSPFIGGKGSGASLWLHGERGSAGRLASGCDW